MTIFLILAPYGAFTLLMLLTSPLASVVAAALVCVAVIAIDVFRGRSLKILTAGSALVFAGLAAYLLLVNPAVAASKVRLAVDAGVFLISAGSMLIGYPFTLQYALEMVSADVAVLPGFLRASYTITAAWTVAMLLMTLSNLALVYVPGLPIWSSLLVAFAARNTAIYFTRWYPEYRRLKYGPEAVPSAQ